MTWVTKWDLRLIDIKGPMWETESRDSNSYLVVNLGPDCQGRDLKCQALCLTERSQQL